MSQDLRSFVEHVSGESRFRVEADLGNGFVRLKTAEAERRQAKHDIRSSEDIVIEMLRNARDAHAASIYVATWKEGTLRRITMLDDGDGIPESMYERIFEARVTSKLDTMRMDLWGVHGRGMALYAVKVNADDACVVTSKVGGGSSMAVSTDTSKLGEKRDQSTLPRFVLDDSGTLTVRGPRNIVRTAAEFAYIERGTCSVFFGSPAEIAAALWHRGRASVPSSTVAFCSDPGALDVCNRLALGTTPEEFAQIAASLGLPLSSRTARRVMDGEIGSPQPLAALIRPTAPGKDTEDAVGKRERNHGKAGNAHGEGGSVPSPALFRDARGLHIDEGDRRAFAEAVAGAFSELAQRYYLVPDVDPDIRIRRDRIDITIALRKVD